MTEATDFIPKAGIEATEYVPTAGGGATRKYARRSLLLWLAFLPLAFIIIVPIMYMATMAFTSEANQFVVPIRWIPQPPTLQNFRKIFADPLLPLGRWFMNSLLVASVGTLIILFVSSLSGYAFARLEFPARTCSSRCCSSA